MEHDLNRNLQKRKRLLAQAIDPELAKFFPEDDQPKEASSQLMPPGLKIARAAPLITRNPRLVGRDLWQSAIDDDDEDDKTMEILRQAWTLHQKVTKSRPQWDATDTKIRGLKKVLKPHQLTGIAMIRHLEEEFGGALLADEVGLGKTLSVLALIRDQRDRGVVTYPTLIIVDKTLLLGWQREIHESFSDMNHKVGTILNQQDVYDCSSYDSWGIERLEVVLTTYDTVRRHYERVRAYERYIKYKVFDRYKEDAGMGADPPAEVENPNSLLYDFPWGRIVAYEAHKLRGTNSGFKISQAVRSTRWCKGKRLLVTGMPYLNPMSDLAAIFAFLGIQPLDNPLTFVELFCKGKSALEPTVEGNPSSIMLKMLQMTLDSIIIQRMAKDHLQLPQLRERVMKLDLDDKNPINYWGDRKKKAFDPKTEYNTQDRIRHLVVDGYPEYIPAPGETLKESCLRARQSTTHWATHRAYMPDKPGSLDPVWEREMQTLGRWRSTKIGALVDSITSHLEVQGVKVLVFESFIPNIKVIGYGLEANGISHVEVHSQRSNKERYDAVRRFCADGGPRVLVTTNQSLNTGANLQIASVIYVMTPDSTPDIEQLCISRAHRIGQDRDVTVYRLIANASMDERIQDGFQKYNKGRGQRLLSSVSSVESSVVERGLRNMTKSDFQEMLRRSFPDLWRPRPNDEELDDVDIREADKDDEEGNEGEIDDAESDSESHFDAMIRDHDSTDSDREMAEINDDNNDEGEMGDGDEVMT